MQHRTEQNRTERRLCPLPFVVASLPFAFIRTVAHWHLFALSRSVCAVCVCGCVYAQPWFCLCGCPVAASVALAALVVYYNCIYHANTYTHTQTHTHRPGTSVQIGIQAQICRTVAPPSSCTNISYIHFSASHCDFVFLPLYLFSGCGTGAGAGGWFGQGFSENYFINFHSFHFN